MSGAKILKKGDILFHEGDPSEVMYVIKSGKIAITKAKGSSEIVLAELTAGDMLGEMAFFDNRPRSAGARAMIDTTVIELPFKSLNAQFKTFPEWLKAVVRTVNNHLRNANQKIKNLERTSEDDQTFFPAHTVTRLMAVLGLVATKFGEKTPDGKITVPAGTLRKYTIQLFQLPTNKMQKLMEMLQGFGYMKVEDLGEGRQRITISHLDIISGFAEFYNDLLFTSEEKRVTIEEKHMKTIKAFLHYGKGTTPDAKGMTKINLTQMQNDSMRDLGFLFSIDDVDPLTEKELATEKMTTDQGIAVGIKVQELETIYPYWQMIHAFAKIQRD